MGVTVIGQSSPSYPKDADVAVVYTKSSWGGSWKQRPELRLRRCTSASARHDISSAEVVYTYGDVKQVHESGITTSSAERFSGHWLRVRVTGGQGRQTVFVGQIISESRTIQGNDGSPTGRQVFRAAGAERLLGKSAVDGSVWLDGGTEKTLQWIPDFNGRGRAGILEGNRSSSQSGGTYLFGGTDSWTRLDALRYVVARYADSSGIGGPSWTVSGQTDLLAASTDVLQASGARTVRDLVDMIIDPRMGVDYKVVEATGGFSIYVFSLVADDFSYGGVSLGGNPNRVRVEAGSTLENLSTTVIRSRDQLYDTIKVQGDRIVVCCSLEVENGSLEAKWDSTAETTYTTPGGADAEEDERIRQTDDLRPVYSHFGAPAAWDHQAGDASPGITAGGAITTNADYQNADRTTLSWIPIQEGKDYGSVFLDGYASGHVGDVLPVSAWIIDERSGEYVPVERLGASVHAMSQDLGVIIRASPAHDIARNQFTGNTLYIPRADYQTLVVTLAFPGDQRLTLTRDISPSTRDGSSLVIDVPGAAVWYLAPNTALVKSTAGLERSGNSYQLLRDDTSKLAAVMAGAVARYHSERTRAVVTKKGLEPWHGMVGSILTAVEEGGTDSQVQSVITSVTWSVPEGGERSGTTTIRTGNDGGLASVSLPPRPQISRRFEEAESPRVLRVPQGGPESELAVRPTAIDSAGETLTAQVLKEDGTLGAEITVALPPELRASFYSGQTIKGVSYVHVSAGERSADGSTEKITPDYLTTSDTTEALIFVRAPLNGTGIDGVNWIDVNRQGRAWARE